MSERTATAKQRPAALQRNPSSALLNQFLGGDVDDRLTRALEAPDARPGKTAVQPQEEGSNVSVLPTKSTEPEVISQSRAAAPAAPATAEVRSEPARQELPVAKIDPVVDQASISVPEERPSSGRKHRRYGNRGAENHAVDMTMSLDPAHAERITELAAYEMLRMKSKISVSEIVRHLLDFALSNVQDNKVIPTSDGCGLRSQVQ